MPLYAVLDGNAVRYTNTEAWWHANGEWVQLNVMEVGNNASVLSEHDYKQLFPDVPALPAEAFH